MDISIVIVSYKSKDLLRNCLNSIKNSITRFSYEVIVRDNGSGDGTVEMMESDFPEFLLLKGTNSGYSSGNNFAINKASGRLILLLNPDTEIKSDSLEKIADFLINNKDAGIVTCKVILPNGEIDPACRRSFPTPWVAITRLSGLSMLFPKSRFFNKYNLGFLPEDETYEIDTCSGAFLMINREVIDDIGLLDEDYFMYNEDVDWCYRAKSAGWKIYYHPVTEITHFKRQSAQFSSKAQWEFHRSMVIFHKKHLAKKYPWIVNWLAYLGPYLRYYIKYLLSFLKNLFAKEKGKKSF